MMSSKGKPQSQTQTTNTQTAKPAANKISAVKGTILGLISGGKTVSCTIAYPDNKGTGTVFVADKKFAGVFNMKDAKGKVTTTNLVSDGTDIYIWSQAMPMAIKMSVAAAKDAASNAQANQNVNVNVNQNVDMQCGAWIADNSKFTVPTNIKFTDVSKFFPPVEPTNTAPAQTGTGASPCDQITNATAKAACVNALKGQGY